MKTVNALMAALVVELIEGAIPSPLTQELAVFALWSDLARLNGEEPPAHVAALLDAPVALCLGDVPPAFHAALAEPVRVAEYEPA